MLSLDTLLQYYSDSLKPFKRFILREYLQHKILQILFESKWAHQLCFLGGTCLRIVHGNTRFSEDLDFDNFQLTGADFTDLAQLICRKLTLEGYKVETKNVLKDALHCYIRFPHLLFEASLSGHREEKILIQLDAEPQQFDFCSESYLLNKFDIFTNIFVVPLDILLAQKFWAVINRKRKKGRDFFDIVFLLGRTQPNFNYLSEKAGIKNWKTLKQRLLSICDVTDMNAMANDVSPFLFHRQDINKVLLFKQYIHQLADPS